MALVIRAKVVDIKSDIPKETDRFLIDTNAWYWLFYTRASQTPSAPLPHQLSDYPNYIQKAISAKAALNCCALNFSELAHNIESAEREIYANLANRPTLKPKEFRHDCPSQRRKVVSTINDTWSDVLAVSTMLSLTLDAVFMQSALTLFPSVGVDGYDLFMAEMALSQGITQIVTDDGDYASVSGITVFTSNPRVIQNAQSFGKLLAR